MVAFRVAAVALLLATANHYPLFTAILAGVTPRKALLLFTCVVSLFAAAGLWRRRRDAAWIALFALSLRSGTLA